jgi:hypothetical protein
MRLATRGTETRADLDVNKFVLEHGRMPFLSDSIPPWHYRGWLLLQVQFADAHPGAAGRWIHYMRTLEAGHLLDEPIPRINFTSMPAPAGLKMIEKCVELLSYRDSPWTAFEKFVAWLAWGLPVSKRMPEIEEATSEALYRTFNFESLILHPHDYLGHYLADHRSKGWNPNAYFPTPQTVCEMMATIVFEGTSDDDGRDPRLRLCAGAGSGNRSDAAGGKQLFVLPLRNGHRQTGARDLSLQWRFLRALAFVPIARRNHRRYREQPAGRTGAGTRAGYCPASTSCLKGTEATPNGKFNGKRRFHMWASLSSLIEFVGPLLVKGWIAYWVYLCVEKHAYAKVACVVTFFLFCECDRIRYLIELRHNQSGPCSTELHAS